jgi:DNA replication protein DnaC
MKSIKEILKESKITEQPYTTLPQWSDLNDGQRTMIRDGKSERTNSRLNIPIRYRGKGISVFETSRSIVDQARAALAEGKSLFLYGGVGTGKTQLAVALMLDWYADHFPNKGYFLSTGELLLQLKQAFSSNQSEDSVLTQYDGYPLLVLDDLGAEKLSDWTRSVFYILIDRIYRNMTQMILTSNLSLVDIVKAMDARIASRIGEMASMVKLDGKDRRMTNAAQIGPILKR